MPLAAVSVAWLAIVARTDPRPANPLGQSGTQSSAPAQHGDVARTALDFARDAAVSLNAFDTQVDRDTLRRGLLRSLGIAGGSPGERDVDRMIPDAGKWAQMAVIEQRSSARVVHAYIPTLWTQTMREHPELPAGAVGVTVTGVQVVRWDDGASRVPFAVTLLLLCPPTTDRCIVNRITASVAR